MAKVDFPTWFAVGSYGGLACSLLAAATLVLGAMLFRRGTPLHLARATLICLIASGLTLLPIWWEQNRFSLLGPTVGTREAFTVLTLSALAGWVIPLGTLATYFVHSEAAPTPPTSADSGQPPAPFARPSSLDDPARTVEPLGTGRPWAQLVPLGKAEAADVEGQPIPLTRKLTLIGREFSNDIVIDDERTSRYHAEIRWDRGRVQLHDRESMNGTFVNRRAVRGTARLSTGDVLEVGAQRYTFMMLVTPEALAAGEAERETVKVPSYRVPAPDGLPDMLLLLVSAPDAGKRWQLSAPITRIGRDPDVEVCLIDASVSRHHAHILRQHAGYYLADEQSSNGTLHNSTRITAPVLLQAGDIVQIGSFTLRCEPVAPFATQDAAIPSESSHASVAPVMPHPETADTPAHPEPPALEITSTLSTENHR